VEASLVTRDRPELLRRDVIETDAEEGIVDESGAFAFSGGIS
jgi:hypothetical protein